MTSLQITGRTGRHTLINDRYELLQGAHNGRPCWVARSVAPRYIFHTGNARWCIGKQLDDGAKCWAYMPDKTQDSRSPLACPGPWVCCDNDNQWKPDEKVRCVEIPQSNDKFVELRKGLMSDMSEYNFDDKSTIRSLWKRLDYNGNNIVSLAEIDKMVVEMCAGGTWPAYLNSKPALMRAYKKTILKDGDGDDWVEKKEFHALLLNLFWFAKLWKIFQMADTGDDRRIDVSEFQASLESLGMQMSGQEAMAEFNKIDKNRGGQILFVEFCAYVRERLNPDADPNEDADIVSGEHCGRNIRAKHGDKATRDLQVKRKTFKDFDELETKVKAVMKDHGELLKLWHTCDFNGNNICSLAEIDRMVVECYPLLNHKPALMRAYKKTIREGNGDDWVQKKEFKALLASIFYFNKIYWLFDEVNGDDRRITLPEFKKGMTILGVTMGDQDAQREFQTIDKNGGGYILFIEFCHWFTLKSCPESLVGYLQ